MGPGSSNFTKCFHILGSFSRSNSFSFSFFINFDLFHKHSHNIRSQKNIYNINALLFQMAHTHSHTSPLPTLIFLLQYLELFADIESLISILSSVAPERRLKFDVIFCANDGRRLFASLLHSFKIVLESWSTWLFSVSSSFSVTKTQEKISSSIG